MHTLIGIVGYCGFVRGYPLGPGLMAQLQALDWPAGTEIRELNWGPVAIVQELQSAPALPGRVVLVGTVDRCGADGDVRCHRWVGGALDPLAVQQRMFEAVTGVVGLHNLLVIGAQFGVWPAATYTVELQWPESGLGDLVLGELDGGLPPGRVVGEQPLTPANAQVVGRLVDAIRRFALEPAPEGVPALTTSALAPAAPMSHHRFIDDRGATPPHCLS